MVILTVFCLFAIGVKKQGMLSIIFILVNKHLINNSTLIILTLSFVANILATINTNRLVITNIRNILIMVVNSYVQF